MLYILDTDILSLYRREATGAIRSHLEAVPVNSVRVTVITVEEQLTGWYDQIRRAKTHESLVFAYAALTETVSFFAAFPILPFTANAMHLFESLKRMRLNVGGNDLRIAAIALESNATVVTRNLRDFQLVPGLLIEDWSLGDVVIS